jgi:tetratricopeptide (TPR) repeat protein
MPIACQARSAASLAARLAWVRRRGLIDPTTRVIAVNARGRQVAEPARLAQERRARGERGIAGGAGRNRAEHVSRLRERGGGKSGGAVEHMRLDAFAGELRRLVGAGHRAGHVPAGGARKLGDFKAAVAQAENEKAFGHLVRIVGAGFFATMLFPRAILLASLAVLTLPALAQRVDKFEPPPDHLRRYTECMQLARREPLKALPMAEKWKAEGGGLGARHCVAIAMYESGKFVPAATQLEAIARDLGSDRPGLRAELLVQAGQAWIEANQAENAAAAQSRALELRPNDVELWVDRGLSHAAMRAWPRAISDFDQALRLAPSKVEVLVLRAAAWRNAGDAAKALADADRALKLAPEHSDALLEQGFALLARGDRSKANADFTKVLKLVPPGSDAAKRAEAGLRGELPGVEAPPAASRPPPSPPKR